MRRTTQDHVIVWGGLVLLAVLLIGPLPAAAQDAAAPAAKAAAPPARPQGAAGTSFEVYGFAMLDIGHNFKQINPNWFDTMRVTRLNSFEDEFCCNNNAFAGVRQSRLGVRSTTPTELGDLKTTFEFELFGVGVDEGQTTFRLRHAYGEVGRFGAGQYWSPFMDPDVFPNSVEYWGPTGMVFFRNVQFRWYAWNDAKSSLVLAAERPGASGDQGVYADRVELDGIRPRFPIPDFSGAWKLNQGWGYFRVAGILRSIKWDDVLADQFEFGGSATGWGINLSSNLKAGTKDVIRLQYVFGEGIQNYMNDSPVDIGVEDNFQNSVTPFVGKAIPIQGLVAFVDHTFNPKFSSTAGYSWQKNDNTNSQAADAFRVGHYALGNLMYYPVPNVMLGGEFQWGRRENFLDGLTSDGVKLQFSFKYNFSYKVGG
jgi:hypothetical protein